jgi:hypothetical protein
LGRTLYFPSSVQQPGEKIMSPSRYFFAIAVLGVAAPAWAQPKAAADLPVSRIVLFSSGVGYFQRDGQVTGNAKIDLKFQSQ